MTKTTNNAVGHPDLVEAWCDALEEALDDFHHYGAKVLSGYRLASTEFSKSPRHHVIRFAEPSWDQVTLEVSDGVNRHYMSVKESEYPRTYQNIWDIWESFGGPNNFGVMP